MTDDHQEEEESGFYLDAPRKRESLVGKVVDGRYKVIREIGSGGMGKVYLAAHRRVRDMKVALKVLSHRWSDDKVVIKRFEREAALVGQLTHPNIVKVIDLGWVDDTDQPFIAMEFCEGRSLADMLSADKEEDYLTMGRAIHYVMETAKALDEAHGQGVLHRDVKPENILVMPMKDGTEHVKLLDFGIAGLLEGHRLATTKLTQMGNFQGTYAYVAPEAFSEKELDRTSDVYSLGVVTFELLTKELPFEGFSPEATVVKKCAGTAPRLSDALGARFPEAVEDVMAKCLEKERSARYQSAGEFARALQRAALTHVQELPESLKDAYLLKPDMMGAAGDLSANADLNSGDGVEVNTNGASVDEAHADNVEPAQARVQKNAKQRDPKNTDLGGMFGQPQENETPQATPASQTVEPQTVGPQTDAFDKAPPQKTAVIPTPESTALESTQLESTQGETTDAEITSTETLPPYPQTTSVDALRQNTQRQGTQRQTTQRQKTETDHLKQHIVGSYFTPKRILAGLFISIGLGAAAVSLLSPNQNPSSTERPTPAQTTAQTPAQTTAQPQTEKQPTEELPTEQAPNEKIPAEQQPTEQRTKEQPPSKQLPTKQPPTKQTRTQQAQAKQPTTKPTAPKQKTTPTPTPTPQKKTTQPATSKTTATKTETNTPNQVTNKQPTADDFILAGRSALTKGNSQRAIYFFKEATQLDSKNAQAWLLLGQANEQIGRSKSAKIAYRKYLKLVPAGKSAQKVKDKLNNL